MAKFGIDAAGMSEARTPHFIAPGVVDQSAGIMANTVAGLIPGAVKAYEGVQLMDQRLKQNEAIEQYENFVQEPDRVQAVGERRAEIGGIWDQFDSGVDQMDAVNVLEKDYNKNVTLLKKAQEQGKLSDSAFLAKMTSITREAVSKNPWMEAEIYSAAQTHLKAMGITDLLDSRAKAADASAKRDEATMKFYREQFAQANMIDQWDQNAGEAKWQAQLQEYTIKKRTIEAGDMVLKQGKIEDATLMRRVLSGDGQKYHELSLVDFQENLATSLDSADGDYDSVLAGAKLEGERRIRAFRTSLGTAASTPEGKELLANVEKDYSNVVTTMTEAGNKVNSSTRLKNQLEAVRTYQEMDARKQFNPMLVDLGTKIVGAFGESSKIKLRELGLSSQKNAARLVVELFDPKNAGEKTTTENITTGASGAVFRGILEHKEGFASRDGQLALTQIAGTTNQAIAAGTLTPDQSMLALNGMLKTVAQNASKMQGQRVNPEFTREIVTGVDTVMKKTVPDLLSGIAQVMAIPQNQGLNPPELDVLPDGSFIIKTDDPTATDKFNKAFSNQINNALDSYAAANGMSREKAAASFYTQYLKNYTALDPELEMLKGQELKIQSPTDAKAALDTKRISQQEYDAIIKSGFK